MAVRFTTGMRPTPEAPQMPLIVDCPLDRAMTLALNLTVRSKG